MHCVSAQNVKYSIKNDIGLVMLDSPGRVSGHGVSITLFAIFCDDIFMALWSVIALLCWWLAHSICSWRSTWHEDDATQNGLPGFVKNDCKHHSLITNAWKTHAVHSHEDNEYTDLFDAEVLCVLDACDHICFVLPISASSTENVIWQRLQSWRSWMECKHSRLVSMGHL